MRDTLKRVYESVTYNLKTLIYFEIIYHIVGLLTIFPLARLLFNISIKSSGFSYITNQYIFPHLLNPLTILLLLLMLIVLSVYIVVEMIFLSLIYDFGYHEKSINLKDLIILGLKRIYTMFKRYHIFIIFPAFLLFFVVHLIHIAGIYSTISFPVQIIEQFNRLTLLKVSLYLLTALLIYQFFETSFSLNLFTIDQVSFKVAHQQSKRMLYKQRFQMIGEFVILNFILNLVFYAIYILIILCISLFVIITKDQSYVLSILLTLMYSIYAVFGLIASSFLIPINFALLSTWYYNRKEKLELAIKPIRITNKERRKFNFKVLKRISVALLVFLFIVNISTIMEVTRDNQVPIEFFNYAEVIAHRGASHDAPENTLAAINLAILQGSDAVEIDVRLSADRHPILFHDETTGRTTDDPLNRNVNALTLEQLKALDAGSWFLSDFHDEKIPTLDEALELMSGRTKAFIELKTSSLRLEIETVEAIKTYDMIDSSIILSFDKDQLRRVKSLNSQIETLLLVPVFYGDIAMLFDYDYIDAYGFSSDIIIDNTDYIDIAHQLNKRVYVWTVNEKDDLQASVASDVDGIITDKPLLTREIVYAKNTSTLLQDFLREFLGRT